MTTPNNTITTKPIIYIDASLLKDSSCDRRLLYTTFYGYSNRTKYQNYQAGYGSAFHRALEYWYSTEFAKSSYGDNNIRQQEAIKLALKYYEPFTPYISEKPREFRTPTHLKKSLEQYFSNYNQDTDLLKPINGVLESKFVYPYYSCVSFDLVLTGTIDMIADYQGYQVFVDHKTTSAYGKEEFFEEYKLSVQMMFYNYIIDKLTGLNLPCVINGIFLKKCSVGAEKSEEFDGVSFERSNKLTFSIQQKAIFEVWLLQKLIHIKNWLIDYYKEQSLGATYPPQNITNPNFAACSTKWGMCPYFKTCSLEPEDQFKHLQLMNKIPYEPLKFSE